MQIHMTFDYQKFRPNPIIQIYLLNEDQSKKFIVHEMDIWDWYANDVEDDVPMHYEQNGSAINVYVPPPENETTEPEPEPSYSNASQPSNTPKLDTKTVIPQ